MQLNFHFPKVELLRPKSSTFIAQKFNFCKLKVELLESTS